MAAIAWILAAAGSTNADLSALRQGHVVADAGHSRAEKAVVDACSLRDDEAAVLARMKEDVAAGSGWFAERRLRNQAAKVHELVETAIRAGEAARAAAMRREEARRGLRAALFADVSRLSSEGDAAARVGASARAAEAYLEAGRRLAEAASIPEGADVDSWIGLDAELPLSGNESPTELEAKAQAYRELARRLERGLDAIAPELAAAESASVAWEQLSRFRGVLDRAGAATADPRNRRTVLRERVERGRALLERATEHMKRIEAQRASRIDGGGR